MTVMESRTDVSGNARSEREVTFWTLVLLLKFLVLLVAAAVIVAFLGYVFVGLALGIMAVGIAWRWLRILRGALADAG